MFVMIAHNSYNSIPLYQVSNIREAFRTYHGGVKKAHPENKTPNLF